MTVPDSGTMAGARVLVVDDDALTRLLVRRALEQIGVGSIFEAGDGEEAQPLLLEHAVDVVITDLLMPRLDGLALIRWAAKHAPEPRWIILSGVDTFDAAVEAVRLGAFEFLTKPPHVGQLQIVLGNVLAQAQLIREQERLVGELEMSQRMLLEKVRELEERSAAVQSDLRRAEVIQRVLLPSRPPALSGLSLQTVYRPGRFVGGDLYNVLRLDERHVAFYVADATGHGVSSAMLSVLFHRRLTLTDERSGQPLPPASVLTAVNTSICAEQMAPGLFLTAAYCLLDSQSGRARLALAGHPPALLHRDGSDIRRFLRSGPALGLTADAVYRDEMFDLRAGDRLLLYTDGILEAEPADAPGTAWLETELARDDADARTIIDRLATLARDSASAGEEDDQDDITLLLLEARPGPSRFDNGAAAADQQRPVAAAARAKQVLFYGESEQHSFLAVRGRGTWLSADAFHDTAAGILDEGRSLVIDLGECSYLDSTMLGTIYELTEAAARRGHFHLQNVPEPLRALFTELDMQRVFDCLLEPAMPLPEMRPLNAPETRGSHARILRAHEQLAALSIRNREKFLGVMEAMRSQLEPGASVRS